MSTWSSCAYAGRVVHRRITPKRHQFAYRVFALCLDVDEIDGLDDVLRWFSRNRTNLVSFWDRDHGASDGATVGDHAREVLSSAGLGHAAARIELLCYPRMLGYAFNPLSVYFCHDSAGNLGAIIYEVSNTFRERKSYVIPVRSSDQAGMVVQECAKEMYVSPFTAREARYGFRVTGPGERVHVGIDLHEEDAVVLMTSFSGVRRPLDDASLLRLVARHPLMTFKVVAAIHFEAARLWLKGVPLAERHTSAPYSFTVVKLNPQE